MSDQDFSNLTLAERLELRKDGHCYTQDIKRVKILNKEKNTIQHRENKNRPREITSKRPVGRFREVVSLKKVVRRDPRFDSLSGKFNSDLFSKAYSFLKDYKDSEIEELKKTIKKTKDHSQATELRMVLTKLQQERAREATAEKIKQVSSKRKHDEREAVESGKAAFYLKKSDKKKFALEVRYEELKESGKLDQFMMKKRKKNTSKDHRWLPNQRKTIS